MLLISAFPYCAIVSDCCDQVEKYQNSKIQEINNIADKAKVSSKIFMGSAKLFLFGMCLDIFNGTISKREDFKEIVQFLGETEAFVLMFSMFVGFAERLDNFSIVDNLNSKLLVFFSKYCILYDI